MNIVQEQLIKNEERTLNNLMAGFDMFIPFDYAPLH